MRIEKYSNDKNSVTKNSIFRLKMSVLSLLFIFRCLVVIASGQSITCKLLAYGYVFCDISCVTTKRMQ